MSTRLFGCLCLVAFLTLTDVSTVLAEPGDAIAGQRIYERLCVACHGQDGRGGARMLAVVPRNLTDHAYMQGRQAAQLFGVIRDGGAAHGLSAAMPAFAGQLHEQEIWDTIAYVRTLAVRGAPGSAPGIITVEAETTALRMTRLRLSIWPEYDDPRVLLIMRGEMRPESAFPTEITLPIPKQAELIGAGLISMQNELLQHPYQVRVGETEDTLVLNLPAARFFVELYHDPFTSRGDEKRFALRFTLPYPVEQLDVDIQKPYAASDFFTEPAAMAYDTDDHGGMYHRFTYRNLPAGEIKAFTVRYRKTSEQPSVPKQQTSASPVAPPSPGHRTHVAFGLLGIVTVLYVGGVLFWKGYQQRREPEVSVRPHITSMAPRASTLANFCSTCGRRLQAEFVFCPGCGRSVRNRTNVL